MTATIGEALREYTRTLKPDNHDYATCIEKLCNDFGPDTLLTDLSPNRIESYAERTIRANDPNAQRRVEALKHWFAWLKKRNYTPTNLGTAVRIKPQRNGRSSPSAARLAETSIEMTAQGIEALRQELADLETRIPDLIRAVETARSDGDLRENAPYHAARESLALAQSRKRQLEEALKRAVVADRSALDDDVAAIGSHVTVTFLERNLQVTYQLVGPREANPVEKKISVESPVGRVLLGRRVGEEVDVEAPQGTMRYRIDAITHTS